jgi:glutamate synthase (NADPH/NADH) small chain
MKVAIIGSGPAGIECAVQLAKKGYKVTIFEREDQIGGLLTYGIPGFRLPRNITKNLTDKIKELGIEIKTNVEFGKDININTLKKNKYNAIFLGIGADIPSTYNLSDVSCEKIYKSDYILKEYNAKRIVENLGDVIVIGGGNVATDSARAAIRMGAKSSTIVYRRDNSKMPARQIELDEALQDGVQIIYNTRVISADIKDGEIEKIKCIKTDSSTEKVVDIENSEFSIKADSIIFAIGLKPDKELIKSEGIDLDEIGLIKTDENSMTNIEGVFAGGDVSQNKATVCKAIYSGREAAYGIDKYINEKGIIK